MNVKIEGGKGRKWNRLKYIQRISALGIYDVLRKTSPTFTLVCPLQEDYGVVKNFRKYR